METTLRADGRRRAAGGRLLLLALMAGWAGAVAGDNLMPWNDTFEAYTNGTPLVNGTNGWYASSTDVIVQDAVVYSGTRAAMIPASGALSNRFLSNNDNEVWMRMTARVVFTDDDAAANLGPAPVDTNKALLLYISTSGYFVAHNGPPSPTPTNSTNWVILTNDAAGQPIPARTNGAWVRLLAAFNYTGRVWSLTADEVLLATNLGFVNPAVTNFNGLALANRIAPTYLDNVAVSSVAPNLSVSPGWLTNSVMAGHAPPPMSFAYLNHAVGVFNYTVTMDQAWLTSTTNTGTLEPNGTNIIPLAFDAAIAGWAPGASNALVTLATTNRGGDTQSVFVALNVMRLQTIPAVLTNSVLVDGTPTQQAVRVHNAGGGAFDYTVASDRSWVTPAAAGATVNAYGTATNLIVYESIIGWSPGVYSATLTFISTNGGGTTQTVAVALTVSELYPPLNVAASEGTNFQGQVRITYDASANAAGYRVWRNLLNDSATAELLGGTNGTVYDDTTAVQETTYYYWVKATNSLGLSAFSAPDTGSWSLGAPAGVSASKRTYADKVRITWNTLTHAASYQVWRNTTDDPATAARLGTTATTTYDDTTAVQETTYYYWVQAVNSLGIGGFSASDTGIRSVDLPPAPAGVSATKGAYADKVVVGWNLAPTATSYEIWRGVADDSGAAAKIAEAADASYSDLTAAITPWTRYYYWVKAKNARGVSAFSGGDYGYCSSTELLPVFADFDGDSKADPALYQQATGRWFVKPSASGYSTAQLQGFGGHYQAARAADFDGDAKADPATYNTLNGNWQIKLSGSGYSAASLAGFGGPG